MLKHKAHLNFLLLACTLLLSFAAQAQFWKKQTQSLLPDDQAFIESAIIEKQTLLVRWQIAENYYMYRDQFSVVSLTEGVTLGQPSYPEGIIEEDPEFGEVVVYFYEVEYRLPILKAPADLESLSLQLKAQGCNKPVGVCYAPMVREVTLDYSQPEGRDTQTSNDRVAQKEVPQDTSSTSQKLSTEKTFLGYLFTAFGAGLLLSFTPCVLPMIPILAGLIGRQEDISKIRSGWLAVCYVLGTVVTYGLAGWVAGASGTQLQAHFQSPTVIGAVCTILVLLALSLFGAYKIQLPSSIQTKLNSTSINTRSASFSSFVLGLISALVVGACVSPILIITLGAAISQGDPVLGAGIMSSMALGMGVLLITFGFGAGWLLPRTGPWMNQVQVLFGFMVLGVAIYLISFVDSVFVIYLWAALLLWMGAYLLRFAKQVSSDLFISLLRAFGIGSMLWGSLALVGASNGGRDILNPIGSLNVSGGSQLNERTVPFQVVTTLEEAESLLKLARENNQPALVDFYADWCLDCKRMDKTTFTDAGVYDALQPWQLIKIDVTETNQQSEAVKRFFEVFGPPATLFFSSDGNERQHLRQYGYLTVDQLLQLANQASS
ncbi:MAG: protein-disulfide reductase DsbD [Gammaproteobacteria bacterium]|nr:protein-disulfide reductase DsbD [Gammaproteobacteria bacterium]